MIDASLDPNSMTRPDVETILGLSSISPPSATSGPSPNSDKRSAGTPIDPAIPAAEPASILPDHAADPATLVAMTSSALQGGGTLSDGATSPMATTPTLPRPRGRPRKADRVIPESQLIRASHTARALGNDPGQKSDANHHVSAGVVTSTSKPGRQQFDETQLRKATGNDPGHRRDASHGNLAGVATFSARQMLTDTQTDRARGEDEGVQSADESQNAPDPLVNQIVQSHRMRRRWMKARNALILQGKAFCRSWAAGDKDAGTALFEKAEKGILGDEDAPLMVGLLPFLDAIARFDRELTAIEKDMAKMAKRLPVAPWVESVRGFGLLSLASIVGEAGDIGSYATVSRLWKRMGLAVIAGERQRKKADLDEAAAHGYNPERRSVMWNVAEPLARLQRTWTDKKTGEIKKPADHYGAYLEAEKAKALAKGLTPAHAENRAKRHMSKRLLADFWSAWRRAAGDQPMLDAQRADVPGTLSDPASRPSRSNHLMPDRGGRADAPATNSPETAQAA